MDESVDPGRSSPGSGHAAEALPRRLTELESKVGLMDDLLDQLNQTVFRQQRHIDQITRELAELRRHYPEGGAGAARTPGEDIPPHY